MKPSEHLKAAKGKIATKDTWTEGRMSEDSNGNYVDPETPAACKFCALGAWHAVLLRTKDQVQDTSISFALLNNSAFHLYGRSIPAINDCIGFDAVHKVYDLAIVNAERVENENK